MICVYFENKLNNMSFGRISVYIWSLYNLTRKKYVFKIKVITLMSFKLLIK